MIYPALNLKIGSGLLAALSPFIAKDKERGAGILMYAASCRLHHDAAAPASSKHEERGAEAYVDVDEKRSKISR